MDDDDPEKRIAELEGRLADPPRPPVPGHDVPIAPRVYVTTVLNMKWG